MTYFPIAANIKSLAITPLFIFPTKFIFIVSGTFNQIFPVAKTPSISVEPIPVEKAPKAPYVQVWLSVPKIISPGKTLLFQSLLDDKVQQTHSNV